MCQSFQSKNQKLIKVCTLLAVIAFADLAFCPAFAQPPQRPTSNQQEKTSSRKVLKTFETKYLLFPPKQYDQQKDKKWPVLIYLHGAGTRGQDLQKINQEGLPFLLNAGKQLPFLVIAPLCPADEWWDSRWSVESLNTLLDEVLENYRADSSRVYVTGWSMGGAGVWRLAHDFPHRFAAIAPLCGKSQLRYVESLKNTAVWAFHGAKDSVVPFTESQKMIDALQNIGAEARLTTLAEAEHEIWPQVYNNIEFYDWLLKHTKK
jgi:predicted peptidase